jgi:hypothetical protein
MSAQTFSLNHARSDATITPTSAAIIGGSTAVAAILAICVGRWFHPATVAAGPNSTASVQQGPVWPDVLNVRSAKPADDSNASAAPAQPNSDRSGPDGLTRDGSTPANPTADSSQTPAPATPVGQAADGNSPNGAAPDAPAAPAGPRQINLDYLLVQSYAEEKFAQDAAAFLISHGIGCTVEHNLPGWGRMYAVVGTTGFSHISTPDYKQYLHRVEALSKQYAPAKGSHGQSYKAFKPMAVKWTRTTSPE